MLALKRFNRAALCGAALQLCAPPARAIGTEPATETTASAPPAVSVIVVGEPGQADTLLPRVMSWFPVETARQSSQQASLDSDAVFAAQKRDGVWVWIWLRSETSTRLFFRVEQAGAAPRYLVTDVGQKLDEVGLEQLGQVVYSSASALWDGTVHSTAEEVRAGLSEAQPRRPAPPAATARRPEPDWWVWKAQLGAEVGLRGAGPEDRTSFDLGVGLRAASRHWALGGALFAGMLLPSTVETEQLSVDIKGASFSLRAQPAAYVGYGWWMVGELGPMLEVLAYTPKSLDPGIRAEAAGIDLRPGAMAGVYARSQVGPIWLYSGTYVVVPFVRSHFDVETQAGRREVIVPWQVQPGFRLGAFW